MTTVPTSYLPLETTFTPPADCWQGPMIVYPVAEDPSPTQWFKGGGDLTTTCFPPGYAFSQTSLVYSPGVCPAGYTSACESYGTLASTTKAIVNCCPSSYACVPSLKEHDWENVYGCKSHLSLNGDWSAVLNTKWTHVSSMYHRSVMVVTTESTTSFTAESSSKSFGTPTPAPSLSSSTTNTGGGASASETGSPDGKELTGGAVAGIAIGAVAGSVAILLLSYIAWAVRKKKTEHSHDYMAGDISPAYPQSPPGTYQVHQMYVQPPELLGKMRHELSSGKDGMREMG